jgi:NADH:ubiquinone oxidoreductase subunit F (NADH-binding)
MTSPMIRPPASVDVHSGPLLLSGIDRGPGLAAHRARLGALPEPGIQSLVTLLGDVGVRGRGGAGFPLARKLQTVMRARGSRATLGGRRPYVVVNAAEGEPASAKDSALLDVAPHLVLDGAVVAARALGAREIHVVSSEDRPWVGAAVHRATDERDDHGIRWVQHEAASRFVSGQSRALIELMAGRPGLPVTSWAPEAVDGHRRRPTLLSNAESFAHLAAVVLWGLDGYAAHGTPEEPGTSLLTLTTPPASDGVFRGVHVVEVEHGDGAATVLDAQAPGSPSSAGSTVRGCTRATCRRSSGRTPCSARWAPGWGPVRCCR